MLGLEQRLHNYEPLFGSWHVCGEIGFGSFGRVYRIETRDAFGTVHAAALKIVEVLPDRTMADTPERVRALAKKAYDSEIGAMYALRGAEHVVPVEDHAVKELREDGVLVGYDLLLRMELMETLDTLLAKERALYTPAEIRRLGMELSRGLICCHGISILHRDINPKNIFRNRFGRYLLGDFGIAKQLRGTAHADTAIGTKAYTAPEVVAGEKYDARADIYSLGIVLYRMANGGYLPFAHRGMSPQEMEAADARRLGGEELPPPALEDEGLRRVIAAMCAFHPSDRFASAQELYDALDALAQPQAAPQAHSLPPDIWQEPQESGLLGAFGLAFTPSPEMRYMARQLAGGSVAPHRQEPVGVLTPRLAAHLPAWRLRVPWVRSRLTVEGYSSIADRAFRARGDLSALTCGGCVQRIGAEAFLRCANLAEVTCADGLLCVGDGAFEDCAHLTRCHLPDTVQQLGARVFAGCTALSSLRVPEGVQIVGERMCDGCTGLHQVTLPSGLRSVEQAAFRGSGLRKLLLPDSCIRLGQSAFAGCRSLASVQVSLRLAVIPEECFAGCTALRQFDLPFRLVEIRARAFFGCTALEQIVIPEGVRRIERQAFAQCDRLMLIRVPDSVQYIGEEALGADGGRLRLTKRTIVARKGSYAWQYCRQRSIRVREP